MTEFRCQFVDSISATPAVRLDLDNGAPWVVQDGTDLSPPPLRRAYAGTLLADGMTIPAAAYDNRVIRLLLDFSEADNDDAATALQRLARELDRPTNLLRWQPNTTHPIFFRTKRSDLGRVQWDPVQRRAEATVLAEPFGYGLLEDPGSKSFADTDPLYEDITGIKGDCETPLIIRTPREFGTLSGPARQAAFATKRHAAGFTHPGILEAETMTLVTDATTQTVVGYSGGTPNCVRVSFATATLAERINGIPTGATSISGRGRWRVFARVKKSVGADPVTMQLRWGGATGTTVENDAVTLPSTTNVVMVDLGQISQPFGGDPVIDGYSGTELSAACPLLRIYASRTSGTTNLEIDYLAILPAEEQFSLITWSAYGEASGPFLVWDGPNQIAYHRTTTDVAGGLTPMPIDGAGEIMVSPGVTNRIWHLRDVTPGVAHTLTSVTYDLSYYPRYLYARPATT